MLVVMLLVPVMVAMVTVAVGEPVTLVVMLFVPVMVTVVIVAVVEPVTLVVMLFVPVMVAVAVVVTPHPYPSVQTVVGHWKGAPPMHSNTITVPGTGLNTSQ